MNPTAGARANMPEPACGPDTPEAQLLAAAAARSEAAVRELIRRNNPRLYRIARSILASDAEAEDVVQDSYLAAFTHLDSFRGGATFSSWITRIAINNALMRLRRKRPEEEYDSVNESDRMSVLPFPGQPPETAETQLGRRELRHLLEAAVTGLPPDLRLVFVLSESEGMAVREIARALDLNPITVKTRLFRARRWLRADLERRVKGGFDAIFPFGGQRCAAMAGRVVNRLKSDGCL